MNESQCRRWLAVLLATGALLVLGACSKGGGEQAMFDQLSTSGFKIGVHFGDDPETVKASLAEPDAHREIQGGRSVDDYYLPEFMRSAGAVPGTKDPQLNLTFNDKRLVRIYAHYNPAADQHDLPPFLPEPLPGLTLGESRQKFDEALGDATEEAPEPKWVFKAKDGSAVTILAQFEDPAPIDGQPAKTGPADVVCSSLTVTLAGQVSEKRGEEFDKRDAVNKRLKGDYGK